MSALVVLLGIGHVASAAPIPLVLEEPEVIYVPAPKVVATNYNTYTTTSNTTSSANNANSSNNAYNKAFNDAYNAGYSAGYNTGYDAASAKNTNVVYPNQVSTYNTTYPTNTYTTTNPNNTYNTSYPNQFAASAYGSQMSGGIYPNSNNGNDLAALSLAGSGGFMPSSIWQWLLVILLILIVIIIVRMLGRKPEHHEVHTVTSH